MVVPSLVRARSNSTISLAERSTVDLSMIFSTRSTRRRPYHDRSKTVISPVAGQRGLEAPKEVVAKLLRRRRADRHDADVAGVEAGRESSDGPALARGVKTFEEHDETRPHRARLEETRGEETKLREAVLRAEDALVGLALAHRLGQIDVADETHAFNVLHGCSTLVAKADSLG